MDTNHVAICAGAAWSAAVGLTLWGTIEHAAEIWVWGLLVGLFANALSNRWSDRRTVDCVRQAVVDIEDAAYLAHRGSRRDDARVYPLPPPPRHNHG